MLSILRNVVMVLPVALLLAVSSCGTASGTQGQDGAEETTQDDAFLDGSFLDAPRPDLGQPSDQIDLGESTDDWSQQDIVNQPLPKVLSASIYGVPSAGLSAGIDVETNVPCSLKLTVENLASRESSLVLTNAGYRKSFSVAVTTLRPSTDYEVTVEVADKLGRSASSVLSWTTEPLPADFPEVNVLVSRPDLMAEGLTVVSAFNPYLSEAVLFMLDASGQVVFYNYIPAGYVRPTGPGAFLSNSGPIGPLCMANLFGNTQWCHDGREFDVYSFHHPATLTSEGNVATLGLEPRNAGDCGGSEGVNYLAGDVLMEFTPEGKIVARYSMIDVLGRDFLCSFSDLDIGVWDEVMPEYAPTRDVTHCNSITIDPSDDNYIVTCLNVHVIAKVQRNTGALLWTMGAGGEAELKPGGRWSQQHHAAWADGKGNVFVYDNEPETVPKESRAVQYRYEISDDKTIVAEQVWEYSAQPPVDSGYNDGLGEVHLLQNGNVMIVDAAINQIKAADGFEVYHPDNHVHGRLTEVTYEDKKPVFQVDITPPEGMPMGFWLLSARRTTDFGISPP